ncbi:AimR family lysis-lysogeny pheromone receptor [Bacillus cereus]|uniref:AimR family lysis-lysogeny pheromone receptor n=1 Tax=Bacillus cereus TaxID=1396 RepID=UPI000BF44B13|nr:AimR family lysis-lysogeny pheromone receptor [Bacillus cereus]PEQ68048.1 hypothetical protein CN469_04515 [Bacillus cereus]
MQQILEKLHKDLYSVGITDTKLAKMWGTSPSRVTETFQNGKIRFAHLSKAMNSVYTPKQQEGVIRKYLDQPKQEYMREVLEYASLKGDFSLIEKVLNKKVLSENNIKKHIVDKEALEIYDLIYQNYTGNLKQTEFFKKLRKKYIKAGSLEMSILTEILLCRLWYRSGRHDLVEAQLEDIGENITKVKNRFFCKTLNVRYKEALCVISLRQGDVKRTKQLCKEIIASSEEDSFLVIPKAIAYFKLGECSGFSNYPKMKKYLSTALEILKNFNEPGIVEIRDMIYNTLAFFKIYHWKDVEEIIIEKLHLAELAFLKIKQGEFEEAELILKSLEAKNGRLSDMQLYYKALLKSDKNIARIALELSNATGNTFYSYAVMKYLGLV